MKRTPDFVSGLNGQMLILNGCSYVLAIRIEELTCGGMVEEVREAFAETMASVVQLCAKYPAACCNSIGLLCIIPYTR